MRNKLIISTICAVLFPLVATGQGLRLPESWMKEFKQVRPLYQEDTLSLCFVGDVMMHAEQLVRCGLEGSAESGFRGKVHSESLAGYFSYIEPFVKEADIAIANIETTFAGAPYSGYPAFNSPDEYVGAVINAGFDVFCCANNHIFDKGSAGAKRTIRLYNEHGIHFTGIGSDNLELQRNTPLMLLCKGIRIALVNFTYGTNARANELKINLMDNREAIGEAISRARDNGADIVIALPHWGEEYKLTHNARQREMAEWLEAQGCDAVIGSHPHVVQGFEYVGEMPVVYSTGNFVSNMSAKNTQMGLVAELKIERRQNGDIRLLEPEFTLTWCSRPGGFNDNYVILPAKEMLCRETEWKRKADYDKMKTTYDRIINLHPGYDR